jgi:hypothetical protein
MATARHLTALLSLVASLRPFVWDPSDESWVAGGERPRKPEYDGGVVAAAHTTFIKAMGRIDAILDDPARWDLRESDVAGTMRKSICQQQAALDQVAAARVKGLHERERILREGGSAIKDTLAKTPPERKLPRPPHPGSGLF